jgi:hypothetical protein
MSRKMAAFALSTARALVGAPVAASVGGKATKAAVNAASRAVPAFARVEVTRRGLSGFARLGLVAAAARVPQTRAFHLTAFAADEEADAAPAEGAVKLYVGNLSWGIDDASLSDLFAEYDASEMTVVTDMNSGRSRGFGFVTVANQAEADKAIAALDGVVRAHARALSFRPVGVREAPPPPPIQPRSSGRRRAPSARADPNPRRGPDTRARRTVPRPPAPRHAPSRAIARPKRPRGDDSFFAAPTR